jgi:hypothetical protein
MRAQATRTEATQALARIAAYLSCLAAHSSFLGFSRRPRIVVGAGGILLQTRLRHVQSWLEQQWEHVAGRRICFRGGTVRSCRQPCRRLDSRSKIIAAARFASRPGGCGIGHDYGVRGSICSSTDTW